ncbi:MAG: nicotinate phosphoribosyltransferase [Deltaproteobacteria bacterium]|nr:nicotinate phosphoribosyltransferase [Deltaproteobacteria bacterium]
MAPSTSLALLTDLYQLTMACAAHREGLTRHEGVFHLFFRKPPFKGGYTVTAGLETALDFLRDFRFDESDLAFLATLTGADSAPLFARDFLDHLAAMRLTVDVDAMPEGTLAYPHEPLLRIQGPIDQCMLLETPLLNLINFQTLIATKSARIAQAAKGEPVLEFGLRRAQGIDGALAASRAAYIGGAAATSNVLAGKRFGIPVRGTHAHSWVMLFDDEREAFAAYARALPNNVVFLVDTYDTLEGVRHAIEAGRTLRAQGRELLGIRLDSGDLAWLSIEARKLLDAAGFQKTVILASNDLDEETIESLKNQGAAIATWGVGTRLVTGHTEPALGGVYKLSAVRRPGGAWEHRIKLSEQLGKVSTPGILQVRRFFDAQGQLAGDAIFEVDTPEVGSIVDPADATRVKHFGATQAHEDLLVPVLRQGERVYTPPPLAEVRARTQSQLARLDASRKRILNPHGYPVGLTPSLHALKTRLVAEHRARAKGTT